MILTKAQQYALEPSERQFMEWICELASLRRWLWYHTYRSTHSVAGYPDLTLVRGSRLIFAELKVKGNKLDPNQVTWIETLKGTGIEVYVWDPQQWQDNTIQRLLE